eukprot:gene4177-4346_t
MRKEAAAAAFAALFGACSALEWSWDTVQTYVHCANKTGAWNDAALAAM